jgi:hypothetical protein
MNKHTVPADFPTPKMIAIESGTFWARFGADGKAVKNPLIERVTEIALHRKPGRHRRHWWTRHRHTVAETALRVANQHQARVRAHNESLLLEYP